MLKPVEMRELRVIVLEDDVDRVIKRLDALGNVHLTDVRVFIDDWGGFVKPSEELLMKSAEIVTKIDNLIDMIKGATGTSSGGEAKRHHASNRTWNNLDDVSASFQELEKNATSLIENLKTLEKELAERREVLAMLNDLREFGFESLDQIRGEFICVFFGKLPAENAESLERALKDAVDENFFIATKNDKTVVISLIEYKDRVERVLRRYDYEFEQIPEDMPADIVHAMSVVEEEIASLNKRISDVRRDLAAFRDEHMETLMKMRDFASTEHSKMRAKMLFGRTEHARVIHGWTPASDVERVISGLKEEVGECCVVDVRKPSRDDRRVPTLLKNPPIIKSFESVIGMYGTPLYRDIDPTFITAIIFPIIFGLMFPDIGHGLILLTLGFILRRRIGTDMGTIISLCGFFSIIGGLLFGEFFGFSMHVSHIIEESLGMKLPSMLIYVLKAFEGLPTFLFEPIKEIKMFFIITMMIGFVHMSLGLVLNGIMRFSERKIMEGISSVVKLWCMFGAVYFILLLFKIFFHKFEYWQAFVFLVLPVILLFIFHVVGELKHHHESSEHSEETRSAMDYLLILIDGVIDAVLENFFRFLANIISYGRILALALCHAALIEVFILLSFMCLNVPYVGIIIGAVIFLLGTVIVILLEAIMSAIHTIRLHFYEWFTKFYEGGGVPFKPFRLC